MLSRPGRWLGHHGRYFIHLGHRIHRRSRDECAAERNLIQLSHMYIALAVRS
jgi:hypothetical protein